MKLSGNPLEDMFTLKLKITKWEKHELEKEKRDTKEEVLIFLQVNIPRGNKSSSYFLIPLKRIFILSFFKKFYGNDKNELNNFAEEMIMSDMVFMSEIIYILTEDKEIISHMKDMLSIPTFEEKKDKILLFCDNYLVKSMCDICNKTDMHCDDFFKERMEYAHKSGLYEMYIEAVYSIIDLAHAQNLYKDDIFLSTTINNTFDEAVKYLGEIDLSSYEIAIEEEIVINDMVESVKILQNSFMSLTDKEKALGQLKVRNHPLSFMLNDRIIKSKYSKTDIFENLCIGVINAAVSVNIINKLTSKDKIKFENHLMILKQYGYGGEELFHVEQLIYLCDSIKYIHHIPTIAISNAYHALSDKETFKLSKFLLPSINKNTVYTHYKNLHYVDVCEQILFEE